MGVNIQDLTYCPPKCAFLHPMMHFGISFGSELELLVKRHANKTHLTTARHYILMILF